MQNSRTFVDLTRLTMAGMPVYPGDTAPELTQTVHFDKDSCVNYEIKSSMHVGTHMDGPMHMVKDGRRLCDIEVERFFGRGVLVDARGKSLLEANLLPATIQAGDIVLFWTDWENHFGQSTYFENFPVLSEALAERLVELKVKMIGLDSPSPDREPYTVHRILLKEEILILENLTGLNALEAKPFEVTALPTKYAADSAPARVVASI
ncbi:MAG: cyclase family protein [Patescibacteria group bacterium]